MSIEHKITGFFHLAAALVVTLYLSGWFFPKSFALIAVAFFIIKGVSFALMKRNPVSAIDAIAGVYLFFPAIGLFSNGILNWIVIIFLIQKGIVYLFR